MTTPGYQPPQPPYPPQPAVQPKKGLSGGAIFGIVAVVALVIMCAICGGVLLLAGGEDKDKKDDDGVAITYEVTGTGTASVTYSADARGSTEQKNDVALPWSSEQNVKANFGALSVVAQRGSDDDGEITCRILKNGREIEKRTSSGPYALVTCTDDL